MAENITIGPDRGKLKIFLGFAPGVGKTHAMLDEGARRKSRGQDVVIAFIEPHGRKPVIEMAAGFDAIPCRPAHVDGQEVREMDPESVVQRHPEVALVDEIAHLNAPGSPRAHRWQDVDYLLSSGISVLTTVNVSHLESLNDMITDITGHAVRDTLPDKVLRTADEVELVDLTPRALINRLERGDICPADEIPAARADFFREGNLMALREIAMREAASRVDEDVVEYRKEKRIEKPWATKDKVMVCISPTRTSLRLLRRGFRMGQRMHGEVIAVHVEDGSPEGERERTILQEDFALAERLGIQTVTLKGPLAPTLIKFARDQNVTALVLGHSERSRLQEVMKPSVLSELARALRTVDLIVVATETAPDASASP